MKTIKRITTTVAAQLERFVDGVENHEAVARCTLAQLQERSAVARVALARMERDAERLDGQLQGERQAAARWRQRAQAADDEARALECLRRSRHARGHAEQLARRLERQQDVCARLRRDVQRLQDRVGELTQTHQEMRARAAHADAARMSGELLGDAGLEDTFERWEQRILRDEIMAGEQGDVGDRFERELDDADEQAELRAELAELRAEATGGDDA